MGTAGWRERIYVADGCLVWCCGNLKKLLNNLNMRCVDYYIKTCGFDTKDINSFNETIPSVFNKYAPIKKKYIRAKTKTCIRKLWSGQG